MNVGVEYIFVVENGGASYPLIETDVLKLKDLQWLMVETQQTIPMAFDTFV